MSQQLKLSMFVEPSETAKEIIRGFNYKPLIHQPPYQKPTQRNLVVDAPISIPKGFFFHQQFSDSYSPIDTKRLDILESIADNKVTIILGPAGIGKTTQVPQFIMDDCYDKMQGCKILVIQPNDVETIAAADYVAGERKEELGSSVAYTIDLDVTCGITSNLVYSTSEVFLRNLFLPEGLQNVTHVIVDEVHERDKSTDLIITYLKHVMQDYPELKVILMSANWGDHRFANYFGSSRIVAIDYNFYAAVTVYLDDILKELRYSSEGMRAVTKRARRTRACSDVDDALVEYQNFCEEYNYLLHYEEATARLQIYFVKQGISFDYQHSTTGLTALMIAAMLNDRAFIARLFFMGCNPHLRCHNNKSALDYADSLDTRNFLEEMIASYSSWILQTDAANKSLCTYENSVMDLLIDYDLIGTLLTYLSGVCNAGTILIFLPGFEEIVECEETIKKLDVPKSRYELQILHKAVNLRRQRGFFEAPRDKLKIVLTTDLAETGIIVENITYVIDCGKSRNIYYDQYNKTSRTLTQWISKDMANRRLERVGFSSFGTCFRLYSQYRFNLMPADRIPEITKVSLESACLYAKILIPNMSITDFMLSMPDPPKETAIATGIENLKSLNVLDNLEKVTPLGDYIAFMLVEPRIGKILLMGVLFSCLDPVLTVAASLMHRSFFEPQAQSGLRQQAVHARQSLMLRKCPTITNAFVLPQPGLFSDHLVNFMLFQTWQDKSAIDKEALDEFCQEYMIKDSSMNMLLQTRGHLLGLLRSNGYVHQTSIMQQYNKNAECWPLVKATLFMGLYPNFGYSAAGSLVTKYSYATRIDKNTSFNSSVSLWAIFEEVLRRKDFPVVQKVTAVSPIMAVLLAPFNCTGDSAYAIILDHWIRVHFAFQDILKFKNYLNHLLKQAIMKPSVSVDQQFTYTIDVLKHILTQEEIKAGLVSPSDIGKKPRFFQPLPALNGQRRLQSNERNNRSHRPVTPSSSGEHMPFIKSSRFDNILEDSVYILITPKEIENVTIGRLSCRWTFAAPTEKKVLHYSYQRKQVFLIFHVKKTRQFQGIAKYISMSFPPDCKPQAHLQWLFSFELTLDRVRHLINPLNYNRPLYEGNDGQVIATTIGDELRRIYEEFSGALNFGKNYGN